MYIVRRFLVIVFDIIFQTVLHCGVQGQATGTLGPPDTDHVTRDGEESALPHSSGVVPFPQPQVPEEEDDESDGWQGGHAADPCTGGQTGRFYHIAVRGQRKVLINYCHLGSKIGYKIYPSKSLTVQQLPLFWQSRLQQPSWAHVYYSILLSVHWTKLYAYCIFYSQLFFFKFSFQSTDSQNVSYDDIFCHWLLFELLNSTILIVC